MENLNPDSDESVLYTTGKLIISGVAHEAVLTGKRLILKASGTGTISQDIPYTDIELAASGTNALREPVIFLTVRTPEGTTQETEIIFIHQAGGQNVRDRDLCITALRDQKVPVKGGPSLAVPLPLGIQGTAAVVTTGAEEQYVRPDVPEMSIFGMSRSTRLPPQEEPSGQTSPLLIAAAFLVIGILIAGIFFSGPAAGPGKTPAQDTPAGAVGGVTVAPSPSSPAPEPTPAPTATTPPAWVLLPGETPPNGIWVRITYPGNFVGSLKAEGWNSEVNSTGAYLFQLPVHDTIIEGSVEKMDGSGAAMDVEILNGGAVVSKTSTSKPFGAVELHVPVGAAVITRAEVTPAPVVVSAFPTPDTSLALKAVPPAGVWVRVAYPGNYTGTIAGNGIGKDVNSSGDQFYQFPMTSGIIDGFVEKGDGSVRNMILQVYKDGTLVSYNNTSAPLGIVEIHTTV
jgi:hypothetical protein